jgi:hypothetical protein
MAAVARHRCRSDVLQLDAGVAGELRAFFTNEHRTSKEGPCGVGPIDWAAAFFAPVLLDWPGNPNED